jgi:zinc transport system ATP-binding protein
MNNILELKKLSVQFWEKKVLNNISFMINKWDIVSLIGKNGTWKSTLIKSIVDINKNYSWEIIKNYKKIWYVPQKLTFDQTVPLTVLEFLEIYNDKNINKITDLFQKFDSVSLISKQVSKLSWWELQKVLIINSLLCEPEFLILDEPTAGIDVIWEEIFYGIIQDIQKNFPDIAILMVSHNMKMVYSHSTKVVCLHQHCYCTWTPDEIKDTAWFGNIFGDLVIPYKHTHDHTHNHN